MEFNVDGLSLELRISQGHWYWTSFPLSTPSSLLLIPAPAPAAGLHHSITGTLIMSMLPPLYTLIPAAHPCSCCCRAASLQHRDTDTEPSSLLLLLLQGCITLPLCIPSSLLLIPAPAATGMHHSITGTLIMSILPLIQGKSEMQRVVIYFVRDSKKGVKHPWLLEQIYSFHMRRERLWHYSMLSMRRGKEYVSLLVELYKNNGSLSCVAVEFVYTWLLSLARTQVLGIQFTWNKKQYLILPNLRKYIILLSRWRHWFMFKKWIYFFPLLWKSNTLTKV